jgi:hypothetical protein
MLQSVELQTQQSLPKHETLYDSWTTLSTWHGQLQHAQSTLNRSTRGVSCIHTRHTTVADQGYTPYVEQQTTAHTAKHTNRSPSFRANSTLLPA